MKSPKVSVVITTRNRSSMLKSAVDSVLKQTYKNYDLHIVDDASDDDTRKAAETFVDCNNHVFYWRQKERKGLPAARNLGIRKSGGVYIAFLDDDDEWMADKLSKQVHLAETMPADWAVIYCGAIAISPEGDIVGESRPCLRGDIRTAIREKGLFTIPSSCLFRGEALKQVGGYDENLLSHIDHDIWLQLARKEYAAEYVDERLVKIHQHQAYKMTENVESRVQATRSFREKWQPELERWFGQREAQEYCSHFTARVMGMLGWTCVYKGNRRKGAKFFLLALRNHPANCTYYMGLLDSALGRSLYGKLLQFWKKTKRWQG